MSQKTLSLTIRLAGRLGWVLTVNGTAYAHGTQAYCIRLADQARRAFDVGGWAAFPDLQRKEARHV
jgi:hypothetical protein